MNLKEIDMGALKKKKVLASALLIAVLGIISFYGSSYFKVFSFDALAQTGANSTKGDVVKIPPPI